MRMRKKKNLDERFENCLSVILKTDRQVSNVLKAVSDKAYFDFENVFGNSNLVEMEIGCGKGGFILDLAKNNLDTNFIAVEMLKNIIISGAEKAILDNVKNLKFLNGGAEYLSKYIKPNSLSAIYLNFSPPYPQKRYENRRLTNPRFLRDYYSMLKEGGLIKLRTDDLGLYEYSKESLSKCGFTVTDCTDSLNSINPTEYERKFRALNMNIYGISAVKDTLKK